MATIFGPAQSGLSSFLDQLGASIADARRAQSIAATVSPFVGGVPASSDGSGGVLASLLRVNQQQPAPSVPRDGAPAAASGSPPGVIDRLQGIINPSAPVSVPSPSVPPPGTVLPTSAPHGAPGSNVVGADASLPTFAAGVGVPTGVNPNTQTALNFYQQKGLSPLAAAALVGGFQNESGPNLNPRAVAYGDGNDGSDAIGLPQWNGSRAQAFKQFAAANRLDPNDVNTQLEYTWQELNGPEKGTLTALQSAANPIAATAAALGYERPAGWTAQNPFGAKTFQGRLQSTVALANGAAPGSPAAGMAVRGAAAGSPFGGLDPNSFGQLPTIAASGQGGALSPATMAFAPQASGRAGVSIATSAGGAPVQVDAEGNALGYSPPGSGSAPASRAITGAAGPAGAAYGSQPLPIGGKLLTRDQAENTDGLDHTDYDAAAAKAGLIRSPNAAPPYADVGASAAVRPAAVSAVSPAPLNGQVIPPAVSPAAAPAGAAPGGFSPVSPDMIRALVQNPDTQSFGLALWQNFLTSKTPPMVAHAGDVVLDGRTGQPILNIPAKAAPVVVNKSLVDPQTGRVVYDGNTADTRVVTPDEYPKYGIPPGTPGPVQVDSDGKLSFPMKSGQSINIDQKAENSSEAAYGKAEGEEFGNILKSGQSARRTQGQLALMNDAFAQGGGNISTGPFAKSILGAKQAILNTTGIDLGGVPESEAVQKLGFGLATNLTKEITNRPAQQEFLKALENVPGIFMSPQGSKVMMSVLNQQAQTQVDLARLVSDPANRKNWPSVEQAYYDAHPLTSPFTGKPLGINDVSALTAAAQQTGVDPVTGQAASGAPAAPPPPPRGQQGARAQVRSAADFNALPSGTPFIDPKGIARVKP